MKTITALEFFKAKSKKQLIENFKEFIDIVKMSNDWATDNMFWIDESQATLEINIDEDFFEDLNQIQNLNILRIDNQGLKSWCEANTMFTNLSFKSITILNFVMHH